jgi:hypothetical protein
MTRIARIKLEDANVAHCQQCWGTDLVRAERTVTQINAVMIEQMRCKKCGGEAAKMSGWATNRTAKILFEIMDGVYNERSSATGGIGQR